MLFTFNVYFLTVFIKRVRLGIYLREKNSKWLEEYLND